MKKYTVKVPIVAVCYVEVEAENEQEAIDMAFESDDLKLENVDEWEPLEHIVEGNVVYTYNSDVEVEEMED
jgi:endonuclease V-like protein UPF0215 family